MDPILYEQHYRLEDQHWWFVGRRRLVLQELALRTGSHPGPILDLGCGTGGMLPYLRQFDTAVGLDSAPEAALACRKREMPFVHGWGSDLPFRDEAFGIITALDVIEHVNDDRSMLAEMRRVLKPGGLLVITVPAYQFLWSQHDEANHHQRRYARGGLASLVEGGGLEMLKASYFTTLLFPAAVFRKAIMRFKTGESPATHLDEVPGPLNALLTRVSTGEGSLIRRWELPFGASLICVARKPLVSASPSPAALIRPLTTVTA